MIADVSYLRDKSRQDPPAEQERRAYALAVINSIKELIQLDTLFKQELTMLVQQGSIEEPARLADYSAYLTSAKGVDLQQVLEALDINKRLELVLELLRRELDITQLQAEIRQRIEERVSKQQREFFLREQLKAIKKELGLEKDDKEADITRFMHRLEERTVSDEAKKRIDEEIDKFRLLEPSSPELNITRNYLDCRSSAGYGFSPLTSS